MTEDQTDQVQIRRAPRFSAFIVVGGLVGLIATLIVTSLFPADPKVGFAALFGYFSIYGVTAGVLVGAVIALILDRRSSRRSRTVSAVVEHGDEGEPV